MLVNAVRVTGTAIAGNYAGPKYAEGFFHMFGGWVLFLAAIVVMLAIGEGLRRVNDRSAR